MWVRDLIRATPRAEPHPGLPECLLLLDRVVGEAVISIYS